MTTQTPLFNPLQFEQRNYVPDWFTSEQKSAVNLTASRVSANLDFVSQFLGWAPSPNYWETLRDTTYQGRRLLSGTYGVYESFAVADVLSVRNWDDTLVISTVPNLSVGTTAYLGDYTYTVTSLQNDGETQVVSFGPLTDQFLTDLSANLPLRLSVRDNRPAPFNRPTVDSSGDTSFVSSVSGTTLTLYPSWDTKKTTPYRVNVLIEGATYYFDRPVFLSYTTTYAQDVTCFYLQDENVWALTVPPSLANTQTSTTAYLVAPYGDSTTQTNATLEVGVAKWVDPSDWNTEGVLKNFVGAWGNKGGALPFNLAFDSLDLHGFDEAKSVLLGEVTRTLSFNDCVQRVYQQRTTVSPTPPNLPAPYDTWWNTETGVYSVYYPSNGPVCSEWVQVEYREPVETETSLVPYFVYPDVTAFIAAAPTINVGVPVLVSDVTGLSVAEDVLGVQGTLTGPGFLYAQKGKDGYWQPLRFEYWNVNEFAVDAPLLPYGVPVNVYDAQGLVPSAPTYSVSNLPFSLQQNLQVTLTKLYSNTNWVASPDNPMKYVAPTALFPAAATPLEGELTWDWNDPDPWGRAAAVWYDGTWADVTAAPFTATPSRTLDPDVVRVLCDGALLQRGVSYQTSTYSFRYDYDAASGDFTFTYYPFTFLGTVRLPKVTLVDALTATFSADITDRVFSGLTWYASPNAQDAETPLRLWRVNALQSAGTLTHLSEDNYDNPLLADLNLGPGQDNWERSWVRLPPSYGRNGKQWDKTNLVAQDFAYFGSAPNPVRTECPPETSVPVLYEEAFLYRVEVGDAEYVFSQPYLYSQYVLGYGSEVGDYSNSGVFPSTEFPYDEWLEGELVEYDPLHTRLADTTLPVGAGYGNWQGAYYSTTLCEEFTGFLINDLVSGVLEPQVMPVWDASVFKFPPTCESDPDRYTADFNHVQVCYAYFIADLSAANEPFFDITQEVAWRFPVSLPKTGYATPRG